MSSSIGRSAVILGCFGTAWAAVRQQIGLLIASYPCCIRRHTLLAVFDCEPSCTLSTFRAFRGCCLSVWRFPKAEPTNHPKAFYLPMVRSCLLASGGLGQGFRFRASLKKVLDPFLALTVLRFIVARYACLACSVAIDGAGHSYQG